MPLYLTLHKPDMPDNPAPPTHPTDESVAAYIDAVLSPVERGRVDAHLSDCEYCRSRLLLASRTLQTAPAPRRARPLFPLAAGLLAAGLAGVLLLSRSSGEPAATPDTLRATEETSLPALRPLGPHRGSTVPRDDLRFVWAPVSPDVLYQVTVSAADGRVLWTGRTTDTIATLPGTTLGEIEPGEAYFWRVDALLSNLQSVTSGDQQFRVSAP